MALSTKQKLWIAKRISFGLLAWRGFVGQGAEVIAKRRALRWKLDLREGIELALYLGVYETKTSKAIDRLLTEGVTVFDIGANIGAHTLPMALKVGARGRVVAFEPTTYAFSRLQANIGLNPEISARIASHQMLLALSHEEKLRDIPSSWPLDLNSPTDPLHGGRVMPTAGAIVSSLDEFVEAEPLERIDLIKLDVDGNELSVLKGARKVLANYRPNLIMEFAPYVHSEAPESSFDALLNFLSEAGYRAELPDTAQFVPWRTDAIARLCAPGGGIDLVVRPAAVSARPCA